MSVIGHSLTTCLSHIARGRADIADVEMIKTSARFDDEGTARCAHQTGMPLPIQ